MTARKPLDPECTGSVFCPVGAHVTVRTKGALTTTSHVPLTLGQLKTLRERRRAERSAS